ncbi:MAG: PAS domain S-box protein [Alphaproteobacteria bacterium]|nr:PAS domain S-box protein [Alphaproteobacteria bacterium]
MPLSSSRKIYRLVPARKYRPQSLVRGRQDKRSTLSDLAARKLAEMQLRESEERFRAIIDTAADPIITFDSSSHIVDFNPAATSVFGYQRREAIGRSIADLILPPQLSPSIPGGWRATIDQLEDSVQGCRF